jgi:hypothetical protein
MFVPLSSTKTVPLQGLKGNTPAETMLSASTTQLNIRLAAGIRLLIGGQMQITGNSSLQQTYYFYYTGGIALRPMS